MKQTFAQGKRQGKEILMQNKQTLKENIAQKHRDDKMGKYIMQP